jgi:hypothetical protein
MALPTGMNRGAQNTPDYSHNDPNAAPPAAPPPPAVAVPLDFNVSFTGRSAPNSVYDTRAISLSAVVSSARLPDFINAIERTNFMTVTDMDLSEVDPWADLAAGYFYGNEHVVRVNLVIETVWLRSWTSKFMPAATKQLFQIEVPAAPTDGSADTPPAPPPAG